MESEKVIGIGIIGFGLSGRVFHSTLLKAHQGFRVVKVLSRRTQEVVEVLPQAEAVQRLEDILQDNKIQLVINCSPNQLHYSYSAAALEAGKHVVVEKPFVITVAEGEKLITLAEKAGKVLTVFQNRRWDADFLTIQKIIKSGAVGEVKSFESHFDRFRPLNQPGRWREQPGPGSGVFYDLGAHLIDQALQLFGTPDEVSADLDSQIELGNVNDYFHVILKYGSMRAIVHGSSFTDLTPRFHIQGTKGNFIKYGLDPQEEVMRRGGSPLEPGFGREAESDFGILTTWIDSTKINKKISSEVGSYLTFYKELYHSIVNNRPEDVPVKPHEALDVIRLIELSRESSSTGKAIRLK